jgi:hypothetical protein
MKDYCSFSPDRPLNYDISFCCKLHDEDYEDQVLSRLECDLKFKQ